mmetsp:Transcript_23979/g.58246  ORF Transcript_23979/g.58246 Transcript_23979/m.58246 type:complete len:308 (-) Transcript_23979:592-1515(-)
MLEDLEVSVGDDGVGVPRPGLDHVEFHKINLEDPFIGQVPKARPLAPCPPDPLAPRIVREEGASVNRRVPPTPRSDLAGPTEPPGVVVHESRLTSHLGPCQFHQRFRHRSVLGPRQIQLVAPGRVLRTEFDCVHAPQEPPGRRPLHLGEEVEHIGRRGGVDDPVDQHHGHQGELLGGGDAREDLARLCKGEQVVADLQPGQYALRPFGDGPVGGNEDLDEGGENDVRGGGRLDRLAGLFQGELNGAVVGHVKGQGPALRLVEVGLELLLGGEARQRVVVDPNDFMLCLLLTTRPHIRILPLAGASAF